jgi:hypothetical protein
MRQIKHLAWAAIVLCAASQAWAWTMYYDGFDYLPASTEPGYKLPANPNPPPNTFTELPYHIGDPRYFNPADPNPIPPEYVYAPSAWVGARSGSVGYWPFVWNDNLSYTGLPASTGLVVVGVNTSSNNGIISRVSPINLNQTPPTGPFRAISRGTLYYSLLIKVPGSLSNPTPGGGIFHAGFNNQPPDTGCTSGSTCVVSRAGARLYLRRGTSPDPVSIPQVFQVGISNDDGTGATKVWEPAVHVAGLDSDPVFVVVSYEFRNNWGSSPDQTDDLVTLWVNPDPGTLGQATAPAPTLTTTGADMQFLGNPPQAPYIQSFFLRTGPTTTGGVDRVVFDEVRIGTSWADVTSDVPCTPATVTGITPATGVAGEQLTGVAITGTNFVQGVTQVRLRKTGLPDITGNNVDVIDSNNLVCNFTIPANAAAGMRDVVVITCPDSPGTLPDGFEVTCNAPTVTSISPAQASRGQTLTGVTISGSNFVAGSTTVRLTMTGQAAIWGSNVTVSDANNLTCDLAIPTDAAGGRWDVLVTTCNGGTLLQGFEVLCEVPAPGITSINPADALQNTMLTGVAIAGSNFVPDGTFVKLTMAGQPTILATNVVVTDANNLTCDIDLTGAAGGKWDVSVRTCASATLPQGFEVKSACAAPAVTSIVPNLGVQGNGNLTVHPPYGNPPGASPVHVTIAGSNFAAGATVKLVQADKADLIATNVVVVDANTITADIDLGTSNEFPPGAFDGSWDVVVTTCAEGSLSGGFTVNMCFTPAVDADGDGDVDLADFGVFQGCFNGPNRPFNGPPVDQRQCQCFDTAPADGDVDLADFGVFQGCFNGPNRPPATGCGA